MSRFFRRRDEAAALDALLDGSGTPGDPTAELLAAARAPENTAPGTTPDGLDAALAAFGRGDRPRRERRTGQVWRRILATTLTTKVVAGASVAVAAAGITVASTRHHTPAPRRPVPVTSDATGGPSTDSSTGPSTGSSRSPAPSRSSSGSATSTTPGASGTGSTTTTTTVSPSGPGSGSTVSSGPPTAGPSASGPTTAPSSTATSRVSRPAQSPRP